MDMSHACTAPTQPSVTDDERTHPRYTEYQRYRNAMQRQMVRGASFASWLRQTEEHERGRRVVFEVRAPRHGERAPQLAPGWWINVIPPGRPHDCQHLGPFATRAAAEAAALSA